MARCLPVTHVTTTHTSSAARTLAPAIAINAGDALAQLSLANYVEMRHKTATYSHLLRKRLDSIMATLMPSSWIPLYSMVRARANVA